MSIYKGGYITIDLEGIALDNGATIPGVYGKITEAYGKPVIFKNVNYNSETYAIVIPATCSKSTTIDFYAWAGAGLLLSISDDDGVGITVIS